MKYLIWIIVIFMLSCNQDRLDSKNVKEILVENSTDEVNYFYETVFYQDRSRSKLQNLNKWRNDISISLLHDYTVEDENFVKTIVHELNSLAIPIKLEYSRKPKSANVLVYFGKREDLNKKFGFNLKNQELGLASTSVSNGTIYKAKVGIVNEISGKERKGLIAEEIIQVLGIQGDSYSYRNSLFYEGWNQISSLSQLDKKIIELLYSKNIPFQLTRKEFERKFPKVLRTVNYKRKVLRFLEKNKIRISVLEKILEDCFIEDRLYKFSSDIPVKVNGRIKKRDSLILSTTIKKFDSVLNNTRIYFTENENIVDGINFYFIEVDTLQNNITKKINLSGGESLYPKRLTADIFIKYRDTVIPSNNMKVMVLNSFYNALGPIYSDEIFSELNSDDEDIIKILYSDVLPDGLKRRDFEDIYNRYKNQIYEDNK